MSRRKLMTDDLAAQRTVKTFLPTWFSFSGRMSPRQYLKRYLILLCVSFAMASATFFFLKTGALDNSIVLTGFSFFIFVTTVIFSVSLVSLIARRLHDFDCRALWAIVLFILLWTAAAILPSLGTAIAFLAMFAVAFKQGDEQANRFGPSPAGEL
jgi:uncharacterized membrane protein YhaH (DUF805 family)